MKEWRFIKTPDYIFVAQTTTTQSILSSSQSTTNKSLLNHCMFFTIIIFVTNHQIRSLSLAHAELVPYIITILWWTGKKSVDCPNVCFVMYKGSHWFMILTCSCNNCVEWGAHSNWDVKDNAVHNRTRTDNQIPRRAKYGLDN